MKWHTTYGEVAVWEQEFRLNDRKGVRFRPFSFSAGVRGRGYSTPLRRRLCDFGADHSFAEAGKKLKEHYGIDLPVDRIRKITEQHARDMREREERGDFHQKKPARPVVIGETDGSMVPIVEWEPERLKKISDKRKCRDLQYREARLSLAYPKGSKERIFAATLGGTEKTGEQLQQCVQRVGIGPDTQIHGVGDGTPWIANQIEEQFGANGHYLIDFYHLCEYLHAAAESCAPDQIKDWMEQQKQRLKENDWKGVMRELRAHREKGASSDHETPVRDCYRYMDERPTQFHYQEAIEQELPIGSGEIESAHRYIIQKRLKLPGAWWTRSHADSMLALRTCRANDDWNKYWTLEALN